MKIEDRIDMLERVIQRMHAKTGHEWFKGMTFDFRNHPTTYRKVCFCGEEDESTEKEWKSLPIRDWPDPDADRY